MAKPPAERGHETPQTPAERRAAENAARLAAALRENLRRRKAQARGREAEPVPPLPEQEQG